MSNDPHPADSSCTLHGPPVIRGNRMYAAFWGGGVAVIDCSDLAHMKLVGHVKWSPPFHGSTHTAWPVGDRPYLVVTDEARAKQKFWDSQFMWVVDIREETNPTPGRHLHSRPRQVLQPARPLRRAQHPGAHPVRGAVGQSGVPHLFQRGPARGRHQRSAQPKEVGCYVPETPDGQEAIQSNDIGCDEHGRLYLIDRWGAGMHILEYTG